MLFEISIILLFTYDILKLNKVKQKKKGKGKQIRQHTLGEKAEKGYL